MASTRPTTDPGSLRTPVTLDLPAPASLRRMLGPGIVAVGIGMAAGELILWPYITAIAGFGLLWLALATLAVQFVINMEIERYTLATGQTVVSGLARWWKGWGIFICVAGAFQYMWPGLGDQRLHRPDVRPRRRERHLDHDRGAGDHRDRPDHLTGHLRHRREDRMGEGRPDAGLPGGRAVRGPCLADLDGGRVGDRHRLRTAPGRRLLHADAERDRRRRGRRGAQPDPEQLDPRQALRHGGARAAAGIADHRDRGGGWGR